MQEFINHALENRSSLPSRKEYLKEGEQHSAEEKMRNLTVNDFLKEFDNPGAHFMNITRKVSEAYKKNVLHYIKQHYPHVPARRFQAIRGACNDLLVPMIRDIEALPNKGKGKGKKTKTIGDLPEEEPAKTDLEFLKELSYLRLEREIQAVLNDRKETVAQAKADGEVFECYVCMEEDCLVAEMVVCQKGCKFCRRFIIQGAELQLADMEQQED